MLLSGKGDERGGFAFAVQPHREVKPESGLTLGNFRYVSMSYYDPLLGPGRGKRRRKESVGFSGGGLWLLLDHAHP